MSVSVLIPSFQDERLTALFTCMEAREPGSVASVIVLDNGLTGELHRHWPQARYLPVPGDPFVAAQAFNIGFAAVPDDDVVVIGDDSEILTDQWLQRIMQLFDDWPMAYGLLSFAETTTPSVYGRMPPPLHPIEMSMVATGSSIAIPRRILREIGPWDETLVGYGFDDFDYGLRLLHAGYLLGVAGDVVLHTDAQATGWVKRLGSWAAMLEKLDVNFEIFHQKWTGRVPPKPWVVERPETDVHFKRFACHCREEP